MAAQYRRKQMRLIELGVNSGQADASEGENTRRLTAFLDRLSEEVTGSARLFLAPDAAPAEPRRKTRLMADGLLLVGRNLVDAIDAGLTPTEVGIAAETLRFLCRHGWRPPARHTIAKLWLRLAGQLPVDQTCLRERREYLTSALRYADEIGTADVIRERLSQLK